MHFELECEYFGPTNIKRHPLLRRLGLEGDIYPLRLWVWMYAKASSNKVEDEDFAIAGKFRSVEQLEAAGQWHGAAGDLVKALKETGFLDDDLTIHNWHSRGGLRLKKYIEKKRSQRKPQPPNNGTKEKQPPFISSNNGDPKCPVCRGKGQIPGTYAPGAGKGQTCECVRHV